MRLQPWGKGENNRFSRLRDEDVIAIRRDYQAIGKYAVAKRHGISHHTAYKIFKRKLWKHLP